MIDTATEIAYLGVLLSALSFTVLSIITYFIQTSSSKQFSYLYLYLLFTTIITYILHSVYTRDVNDNSNAMEYYYENDTYWSQTTPLLAVYLLLMSAVYCNKNFTSFFTGLLIAEATLSPIAYCIELHYYTNIAFYCWTQYTQCNLVMALCLFQLFDTSKTKMAATYVYVISTCLVAAFIEFQDVRLFAYQSVCWAPILLWAAYSITTSQRHRVIEQEMSLYTTAVVVTAAAAIVSIIITRMAISTLHRDYNGGDNTKYIPYNMSAEGQLVDMLLDVSVKTIIGFLLLGNRQIVTFLGQTFILDDQSTSTSASFPTNKSLTDGDDDSVDQYTVISLPNHTGSDDLSTSLLSTQVQVQQQAVSQ